MRSVLEPVREKHPASRLAGCRKEEHYSLSSRKGKR
jgi:hypothetical protein